MPEIPLTKVCVDCGEEKLLSEYYLDKNGRPPCPRCKDCYKNWHNQYRRNKTREKKSLLSLVIPTSKTCSKCAQEKSLTEFYKDKEGKFGVSSICKSVRVSTILTEEKTL
jgi:hypothetical protein